MSYNFEELTNNIKHNHRRGGGGVVSSFGLWEDKHGKNRHIKTSVLGIENGQGFILDIIKNKITIITLADEDVKQFVKHKMGYFASTTDGGNKYHNYAVIDGLSEDIWQKMKALYNHNDENGCAKSLHKKDFANIALYEKEKQDKFQVISMQDYCKMKNVKQGTKEK